METLQELCRRHEALKLERSSWERDWQRLAQHFCPTRCRLEREGRRANDGRVRGGTLDSTGFYAMRDLAAGLHGGLSSPARPWFRLAVKELGLDERSDVKIWLDQVNKLLRFVFHRSGFYKAVHTLYAEIGTFGTGFMFCLADEEQVLRFLPLTTGEYCLDTDEQGQVDTVFRTADMSLRQIVRSFPKERLPAWMLDAFERGRGNWTERYRVVHAVYPRWECKGKSPFAKAMPFASVYYLEGGAQSTAGRPGALLSESGFLRFPGFGVRWEVTGNDVYGKSPTMDALPDSVLLQQMVSSMLQALHKEINPPMVAPEGMENVSLLPGAANFVSSLGGAGNQIYPAVQIRHNIEATMRAIEGVRDQVRKGLFNDLFRMLLNSDRRQITAREVAAREEEKLLLVGPTLERLHDELFVPLIDLAFDGLARAKLLPPPPEDLQGEVLKVEFMSVLAQAQKMVATGTMEQFAGFVGRAASVFPELLDAVNSDKVLENYAEYIGVEANVLRGREEREAIRADRAQEQARIRAMSEGVASLEAVRSLGKASLDKTALGGLVQAGLAGAEQGAFE